MAGTNDPTSNLHACRARVCTFLKEFKYCGDTRVLPVSRSHLQLILVRAGLFASMTNRRNEDAT